MIDLAALRAAVDAAFVSTAAGMRRWQGTRPHREPTDDEYSRVTDPAKWLILGARIDAWASALVAARLAEVVHDAPATWRDRLGPIVSRTDRLVPTAPGAMPLVVARTRIVDVLDAGIVIGVGDPALELERFPDCGCDACDSGSTQELEHLDRHLTGVVTGTFRQLSRGGAVITVIDEDGWSASNVRNVDAVLADPRGWDELSGASWLSSG